MTRDFATGLAVGFAATLIGAIFIIGYTHDYLFGEMIGNAHDRLESGAYYDISRDMHIIQMAEAGENDAVVNTVCVMLRTRLEYVQPERIHDPELRKAVGERRIEALKLISKLEKQGRCLTNH